MKKCNCIILFFVLVLAGCGQKPADVVYKRSGIYTPNYTEVYVESPDGKIARSLRGRNDSSKAQEISIINEDRAKEINIINKNAMVDVSNGDYYVVKSGDNLWSISRKYDTNVSQLANLNNIKNPNVIMPEQRLKVAGAAIGNTTTRNSSNNTSKAAITIYKVKSGDNLTKIANKFNMEKTELAELNDLKKPYNIRIGQKLKVKKTQNSSSAGSNAISSKTGIYVVKSGDSLSTIAERNNMSLGELAELNNIDKPYNIRVGQKLRVNESAVVVKKNTQNSVRQASAATVSAPKIQKPANPNKKNSFMWPVKGEIVSSFGNKPNGLYNDGINISANKGANFKATEDGVVAYVGNELRGYGTIILIKHSNNWISAYAHCDSVKVARGDRVEKGQIIGTVGQTGNVSSPQLYFSLRSGREAVDPTKYLE